MEGTDLIYEGITTESFKLEATPEPEEGTDLIYEGITTCVVNYEVVYFLKELT
jgi:hypothetical protein